VPADDPVVTRFAPSPTGHLHVGGARTALFCWAHARRHGGRFILRIEDTDQARSSEESARGILDDLAWLGIEWDEGPQFQPADGDRVIGGDPRGVGPFFQSRRVRLYDEWVERLVARDLAYHAFETPAELEARRRSAAAAKRTYRYDRAALSLPRAERLARARAGEAHVVRFLVPEEPVRVVDEVLGEIRFDRSELEDFVIRKADRFPTYHFAVVVDDELMGVTHVLRGQEHLNNTPRHVMLQKALGFRTPRYAHMPLIFNPDGSKMSKRDKDRAAREACRERGIAHPPVPGIDPAGFVAWLGDARSQLDGDALRDLARALRLALPEVDVDDFRRSGYLPEVLCNYLALLGWSPGGDLEKFDRAYLSANFSIERIGRTNARFDRAKLLSFNGDAIGGMSGDEFRARWRDWCARYEPAFVETLDARALALLAEGLRPRVKTFREAADLGRFALVPDDAVEYDVQAVAKVLREGEPGGLALLRDFAPALERVHPFDPGPINEAIRAFCDERGLGMGKLAQPLRVALTGSTVSPPIDLTLAVLGPVRTMSRLARWVGTEGAAGR
jgi:glutamyl/glutaminyl-tRNA synthetase